LPYRLALQVCDRFQAVEAAGITGWSGGKSLSAQ
jgi:hypothetical protein